MAGKTALNRSVARAVTAAQALGSDKFTAKDLAVGSYAIARAIAEGYIKPLKKKVRTGKRGRPATLLQLTAKGKRANP